MDKEFWSRGYAGRVNDNATLIANRFGSGHVNQNTPIKQFLKEGQDIRLALLGCHVKFVLKYLQYRAYRPGLIQQFPNNQAGFVER
jgi:hypothetical protein